LSKNVIQDETPRECEHMKRTHLDKTTTVSDLKKEVDNFVKERNWQKYHKPKDLAISIAIESSELLEHFQWLDDNKVDELLQNCDKVLQIEAELADILIYCINFSNVLNADLSQIIANKLRENERKYPVNRVKGSYKKYTEIEG
jgi:dCTP diphosphatase